MRLNDTSTYQEMMINSKMLEVPRGTYQRELNIHRVRKIAAAFNIRLLNPPTAQGQLSQWPLLCV